MKKTTLFEFAAGLLLLVSALYTYIPQAWYMYELTFISNTAGAVLFISDALYFAPAFVTLYLLFDYIRFLFTGSFVYGLFPSDEMSIFVAVLIGFAAYLLTFGLGFVFCLCGKAINKRKAVRNNE